MSKNIDQPAVVYEFVQLPEQEAQLRLAIQAIAELSKKCQVEHFVVPSDAIGEDTNIDSAPPELKYVNLPV